MQADAIHPYGDTIPYDPKIHHRRSTRLPHWDYSWGWWYYVTIVVKDCRCAFGQVKADRVVLSGLGKLADDCWREIAQHHAGVELGDYVVMPNHIHGIIIMNDLARRDVQSDQSSRRDVQLNVPTEDGRELFPSRKEAMGTLSPKKDSLSVVVRTFKAAVTMWARKNGFGDFAWQGRFHDHIIRNDADLHRIRAYIANNPLQWAIDDENPDRK
jgi:putative transposase